MSDLKQQLVQDLNAMRDELRTILDALDETVEIYPGWRKREFLAHIAGWEAMVFDVIRRHLAKQTPLDYGYTDVDSANARFVAVRQSTTVEDARLECEINRFAILTLLDGIADFSEEIQFPWGTDTVVEFIEGAIEHERNHADDMLKLNVVRTESQMGKRDARH